MRSAGSRSTLVVWLIAFAVLIAGNAQGAPKPSTAPLNPLYVQYMQDRAAGRLQAGKQALGYVPPPFWIPQTGAKVSFPGPSRLGLPTSYDLRTTGKLTGVRDQAQCGSCWAFATIGSMESCLLPGETTNLSENHLKNLHGFDWSCCDGGNITLSTSYMARWAGPVLETDDRYAYPSCASPTGLAPRKHVQEVIFIPDKANALDNDTIKQAVMTYGAIYTTFFWSDACYNGATYGYYDNVAGGANHAVCIVGWDDNFDKSKFPTTPAGNGAFLVRNSWGGSWGDAGYFYVSYYDANFGKENGAFNNAEGTTRFSRNYQYDPYGCLGSVGYGNPTGWMANVFTAVWDEPIGAASFYSLTPNTTYELRVYLDPTAGGPINPAGPVLTQTGTLAAPGYHTIAFTAPVNVTRNHKFSIVVKITTPGFNYPMAYESPSPGYCSPPTANPGESFISYDGGAWGDLTASFAQSNCCIKAFASGNPPVVSVNPRSLKKVTASGGTARGTITVGNTASAGAQSLVFTVDAGAGSTTYNRKDSGQAGGPSFNWLDASAGTAVTGLGDDNVVGPVPIGFSFPFYGVSYSQVWVGSNGLIGFGPTDGLGAFVNTAIPSAATPNNAVYWMWDDLFERPDSRVTYRTLPEGFVIQFSNYGCYAITTARVTAEVVLKPSGEILIQYSSLSADWPDATATIGIENATGTAASQAACNTSYAHSGLAVSFAPQPDFFQVSPLTGTVAPGSSAPLNVTFTTTGLPDGIYRKSFTIQTTDPITPAVSVSLELQLSGRMYTTPAGFVKAGAWNLVSVPADPISPDPLDVFATIDVANASFQYWKNDQDGGGYRPYGVGFGWTGPILRGTPYWFIEPAAGADKEISFPGVPPSDDFTLTIPAHFTAPFWVMLGAPFPDPVPAATVQFKNIARRGDTWVSWVDASSSADPTQRLVESNAQGWQARDSRFVTVNDPTVIGESHQFDPWWGYWLLVMDSHELQIRFPKP